MSSLRMSPRVRPKSPPLQPPSTVPASSTRAGSDRSPVVRIGRHDSGILKVRGSGAPTTTATGCGALFRSAPVAGFAGLTFDADNGEDQHGSQAFAWSAIHG